MRVKLVRKLFNFNEWSDIEPLSYNHYYNVVSDKQCEVIYWVVGSKEEYQEAIGLKSQKEIP